MSAAPSTPDGELYCTTCEKSYEQGERCPIDGTKLVRLKRAVDAFLGRELDGRYTVIEKLGQGGMGAVYRAEQHSVGRAVAIKVVNTALVSDPEVVKRFLREAKIASKLAHPNAVAVLDFGQTDDGVFYLVMELVSGRTLDAVIKSERILPLERTVRIGMQICDALDGAHALSIIHRDLKPSNVMLLSHGRDLVKVLDFGLAKSMSPDSTATTMTGTGAVVGTPAFMPPELATGEKCDGRADLYSLGCILYLMASGRLPFHATTPHEMIAMHASDTPAPRLSGVPPRFAAVVHKLLEKAPAKRFQSAGETLHALERSLGAVTPGAGVPRVDDTAPSIGPFPASDSQFVGLETPLPPSLAMKATAPAPPAVGAGRRALSEAEMNRLISGETMLDNSTVTVADAPMPPTPPTDVPSGGLAGVERPRSKRWMVGLLGLGVVAAIAIIAVSRTDGSSKPAAKERVIAPPSQPVTPPIDAAALPPTPVADPAPVDAAAPDAATVTTPRPPTSRRPDRPTPSPRPPTPTPSPGSAGSATPPPRPPVAPPQGSADPVPTPF